MKLLQKLHFYEKRSFFPVPFKMSYCIKGRDYINVYSLRIMGYSSLEVLVELDSETIF